MKPKFNNTENSRHTSKETGEVIFKSRSTAVCVRLKVKLALSDNDFFLITQRGEGVNHTGKWCLPCGYVDYSETTLQAAQRELYEETGIYIEDLTRFKLTEIVDDPERDELQNITFHYDVETSEDYYHVVYDHINEHLDEGEVTDFEFIYKHDVSSYGFEFAFNHDKRIV